MSHPLAALFGIRHFLALFPASTLGATCPPQVDQMAERLEHLSALAADCELPEDAAELGREILEWHLAAQIGVVGPHSTYLVNRLMGRAAVEAIVQKRIDGWSVEDRPCLFAHHAGYAIVNHTLIEMAHVGALFALGIISLTMGLGGRPFPPR